VVAPDGELYVAWTRFRWAGSRSRPPAPRMWRSFVQLAPPWSTRCGRGPGRHLGLRRSGSTAIRTRPFRSSPSDRTRAPRVYSYDPAPARDTVDVFYRRSTDRGASWDPSSGSTTTHLTTSSSDAQRGLKQRRVRLLVRPPPRPANLLIDHYQRGRKTAPDLGPSERVSDFSTPVYLDPAMATATTATTNPPRTRRGLWSSGPTTATCTAHSDPTCSGPAALSVTSAAGPCRTVCADMPAPGLGARSALRRAGAPR